MNCGTPDRLGEPIGFHPGVWCSPISTQRAIYKILSAVCTVRFLLRTDPHPVSRPPSVRRPDPICVQHLQGLGAASLFPLIVGTEIKIQFLHFNRPLAQSSDPQDRPNTPYSYRGAPYS